VTIADRTWDDLPPEIHSRIMAATAHADDRLIRRSDCSAPGMPDRVWEVDALTGDRVVHMVLGLRTDGSVAEATRTFLISEIREISLDDDGCTLEVVGPSGPESMRIPEPIGRVVRRRCEGGFEGSVKGIGQGIAGRLKELAGELFDDPGLEEAGIAQQLEGKTRRTQDQSATGRPVPGGP